MKAAAAPLLATAAALLLAAAAAAQEPPPPAAGGDLPAASRELKWDRVQQIHYEHGPGILFLLGDVDAEIDGRRLRCQNLIAWIDTERRESGVPAEPQPGILPGAAAEGLRRASEWVREIYAEGHVIYEEPGRFIQADRLYLDLRRQRGLVIDSTVGLELDSRNGPVPLVVKAQELRMLSANRMAGSGVRTYLSPLGRSGNFLHHEKIEFIKDPSRQDDQGRESANYHLRSTGSVVHAGGMPVIWLPDFVGDSAEARNSLLIAKVRARRSNRFGIELGTSFSDEIVQEDGTRWGKWTADLDWYSKRGPGGGGRLDYGTERYYGTFIGRYQRDHGEDRHFGDPGTKNRGRLSAWHRHFLPEDFILDAELQLFSDRGFMPTYFEGDHKGLKPPENLLYLRRPFFNSQVSALGSQRFSRWLTTVEHTPELRYDLVSDPLFDIAGNPLLFTTTLRASNSRIEYDKDLSLRPRDTMRTDIDTLVEYPFDAGPVKIIPFTGLRHTWFQRDLDGDRGRNRFGITSGATVALHAWRIYDAEGGLFDLDGLRHVVSPEITFRNTSGVRIQPDELIRLDDIEDFDNEQVVEFRLRSLFQTVRHRPRGPDVDSFLDIEIEQRFFPNARRDNRGEPWGNLDVDLLVKFSDDLQFVTDFEVNYYGRGFEVANVALGYTPSEQFQLYTGYRHFHETYDAVFLQANYRIDERWMITGETSYDLRESRGLDHRFVLSHIGPEWVFQVGVKADLGQDDFSIMFSFEPRWLFDPILSPSALGSEPRLHYLGSGLRR